MQEPINIKVTLLGDCGVGKSSIIQRFTTDMFQDDFVSNNGGNSSQKEIKKNNKEFQLDIWDTAGQEKYRSLGKNFYRDAFIIILVYDITNLDSLNGLKDIWYPDLLKYGEKYKILAVVGNKSDRNNEENIVKEEVAKSFADEINSVFMVVSAKNGDNINNLFDKLIELYDEPEFQKNMKENTKPRKNSIKIRSNSIKEEKEFQDKKKSKCC
jgi:small GTP-binding protein